MRLVSVVIALASGLSVLAHGGTTPVCGQKAMSTLVRQADVVAVVRVKSVGKPPGYWSGIVAAHQSVNYSLVSLLKGSLPVAEFSLEHLVVANGPTADSGYPQLSPKLFRPERQLLLFLHVRNVKLPDGKGQLLIDILPENCAVSAADSAKIARTRSLLNVSPEAATCSVSALDALHGITKYVAVTPEPHMTRAEGVVSLRVVVGVDGRVTNIRMLSGHPIIVPKAIDAVRQWELTPTVLGNAHCTFQFDLDVPVKNSAPATLPDVRRVNQKRTEPVDTSGVLR
jgi:hypothetical protein